MKKLLMLTVLLTNLSHAAVVCEKQGRFWYPKNEKSVKMARLLGVKTCNGKRFKALVKKLGETSNVKAGKKSMSVDEAAAALR